MNKFDIPLPQVRPDLKIPRMAPVFRPFEAMRGGHGRAALLEKCRRSSHVWPVAMWADQLDRASLRPEERVAVSQTADSVRSDQSSMDSDRRRLIGIAAGCGVLFLVSIIFGLGQGRPAQFANLGDYAPAMSIAGDVADGGVNAVTDESRSIALDNPDTTKEQAVEPNSSTGISDGPGTTKAQPQAQPVHDTYYCNIYAATVTGNLTPEQAARREQANGAITGAIGGAVLGAIFGGSGKHPGRSALLGAGSGLVAGVAMGTSNGNLAADDIRRRYADAYSTCMNQKDVADTSQPGS